MASDWTQPSMLLESTQDDAHIAECCCDECIDNLIEEMREDRT